MESRLPLLPQFFEKYISHWANRRLPPATQTTSLTSRQLYILPTRHGVVFMAVVLLVLVGAINYENSLGYMLAFLLSSIGFLAMIYTHQNINRLQLSLLTPAPVFAGQNILFPLSIQPPDNNHHLAIFIHADDNEPRAFNLTGHTPCECKIPVKSTQRGYTPLPRIKIYTEFPFGLFHAWSWVRLDAKCLVYPAPASEQAFSHSDSILSKGNVSSDKSGVDDFAGIREYQSGDSPGHMAWKAIARTGILQTKVYSTDASSQLSIDWFQLDSRLDIEHRLSILCRMIIDADEHGLEYMLVLPDSNIDTGSGLHHKQLCLKALALFGKQ